MRDTPEHKAYLLLLAVVTAAFFRILLPFYGACFWAVVLAIIFQPMQRSFERRFGPGSNRAALASLTACIFFAVIPLLLVGGAIIDQAARLSSLVRGSRFDVSSLQALVAEFLPEWAEEAVNAFGGVEALQARVGAAAVAASEFMASQAVSIGQDALRLFVSVGIMLYVLFFLFRDGREIGLAVRDSIPLHRDYTVRLLARFTSVVRATVKGNVAIALVQGGIGGIAFWLLGIQAALLWGVVMALLSLVPAVGSALLWFPTAIYFLLSGEIAKGVILLGVGVGISFIDNLLRPRLVGRESRLPDYVVLVSTLGGLSVFGPNGFIIGPLIASLFIAGWGLYREERDGPQVRLAGPDGKILRPED